MKKKTFTTNFQIFTSFIEIFSSFSHTLKHFLFHCISIQVKKNGMQIGGKAIENMLMNMVVEKIN
jgi:hypothetical protein